MPGGRPTDYSPGLGERIAELYASGWTLSAIGRRDDFPAFETISRWISRHPEFGQAIERARSQHADALAGQVVDIADTELDPQRARNRMVARQWAASKLRPERYGERVDVRVSGSVSVVDALAEARSRAARPICDLSHGNAPQVIDATYETVAKPRDDTSSAPVPAALPSIFD